MSVPPNWRAWRIAVAAALVVALATSWLAVQSRKDHAQKQSTPNRLAYGMSLSTALYGDDATLRREVSAVSDSGAKWLRVDFDWAASEPQAGALDWSYLDRLVALTKEEGLSVLAVVGNAPEWARAPGTNTHSPPLDLQLFAEFAGAAASRYRSAGVRTWEVWNEPNIVKFWEPRPDAVQYANLLELAAAAIRAANPEAYIISGGMSPAKTSDETQRRPDEFLSAIYDTGAMAHVDAVAMHPYTFPGRPSEFGSAFDDLVLLRQLMQRNGDPDAPIWITEFGAPTGSGDVAVSEDEQARILADACVQVASRSWLSGFFVYQLSDGGTDTYDIEQNFGLLRSNQSPKPSWQTWLECND